MGENLSPAYKFLQPAAAGSDRRLILVNSHKSPLIGKPPAYLIGVSASSKGSIYIDAIRFNLQSLYRFLQQRGFSYREDAPLDMRMDQRQEKTAKDIVNGYSEAKLYQMIRDYGEDKFAKNIKNPISSSSESFRTSSS